MAKCCDVIYWKHEDGWDAYRREDCHQVNGSWIPLWFDAFIIEDVSTKQEAQRIIKYGWHALGVCFVS